MPKNTTKRASSGNDPIQAACRSKGFTGVAEALRAVNLDGALFYRLKRLGVTPRCAVSTIEKLRAMGVEHLMPRRAAKSKKLAS